MAYLIAGYIRDTLTNAEHKELDDWVNESDNSTSFLEIDLFLIPGVYALTEALNISNPALLFCLKKSLLPAKESVPAGYAFSVKSGRDRSICKELLSTIKSALEISKTFLPFMVVYRLCSASCRESKITVNFLPLAAVK